MEVLTTPIEGVLLIKPKVFGDSRGFFVETWQDQRYAEMGINVPFVQDNHSRSTRGILRGLHFQRTRPQGKLVSVSFGDVYDVVVDIRPQSSTFGAWYGAHLTADSQHQLYVPPGMAHGFCVLSDIAHFHYKCTDYYLPDDEGSVRWDDPTLAIEWPLAEPLLSARDSVAPLFDAHLFEARS